MAECGVADVKRLQNIFRDIENNSQFECGKVCSFVTPNPEAPVYPNGHKEYAPYTLAIIEFSNGKKLMAQLTDVAVDEPVIGMKVERVTRKLSETNDGVIVYGVKYRPVLEEN